MNYFTHVDEAYKEVVDTVLHHGEEKGDRTGTGTISIFNYNFELDLEDGFPLITTKFVPFRLVAVETLMFLKGITNLKYLLDRNVDIWTRDAYKKYLKEMSEYSYALTMTLDEFREDAKENGYDLGPIYGSQWRNFNGEGVDQLQDVIRGIKHDPDSRRLKVYAANPAQQHKQTLPPCHDSFQFYVRDGEYLDLKFTMRSSDVFHGLPFNIASYALICHLVARITGKKPGRLIYDGGDVHLYKTHIEAVKEQIKRKPFELPELVLNKREINSIDDFEIEDFQLLFYKSHPAIKQEQAF